MSPHGYRSYYIVLRNNVILCPLTDTIVVIQTIHLSACPSVCASETLFCGPITHWTVWLWSSIIVSTVSWDDEVVHKTCCFDLDNFLTFFQSHKKLGIFPHCTMKGGHFVDTIAHWTVWLWPSIMVSTASNDDVVVHKTYCFDLDLSLILYKVTNNLDYFPFLQWMLK